MKRPTTLANALASIDGSFVSDETALAAERALVDALGATVWVRGPKTTAGGQREYIEAPDHALRIAAGIRLLEWKHGKPVAQMMLTPTPPGGRSFAPSLHQLVSSNPTLVERILNEIAASARPVVAIEANIVTPPTDDPGN